MKTKLLRKLRQQAEKKIYVRRPVDGSYEIYHDGYIYKDFLKEEVIEFCKFLRRLEILEELGRLRPPKRIF